MRYAVVGHIIVIASTVQIHTLLFSEPTEQISAARRRLERNFEILSQLRTYWPTLDICFTRLEAFHKACRSSIYESFRLDQWVLRFCLNSRNLLMIELRTDQPRRSGHSKTLGSVHRLDAIMIFEHRHASQLIVHQKGVRHWPAIYACLEITREPLPLFITSWQTWRFI